MTHKNAITEARDALKYANENLSEIDGEDEITANALAKLEALIAAVPTGLDRTGVLHVSEIRRAANILQEATGETHD